MIDLHPQSCRSCRRPWCATAMAVERHTRCAFCGAAGVLTGSPSSECTGCGEALREAAPGGRCEYCAGRGEGGVSAREEMAPRIIALRAEGLTWHEIGERVGLALSTVADYGTDPDGTRVRARKARSDGKCRDCGGRTVSSGGRAPERCMPCNGAHTRELSRRWILDSFEEWYDMFGVPPVATDWSPAHARAIGMNHRPWPSVSNVQNIFGSWNAGRAAAGFDTFTPGRYGRDGEDPRVCEETVRLYRSGLIMREVGERMGVSGQAVQRRLVVAGEPRRPAGRPKATERAAA